MFIIGKIKTFIIAGLALLLPILYVLGRRDGKKKIQNNVLTDELAATTRVAEFYKKIAENEEDFTLHNRDDLTDRLRRDGL